MKISTTHIEGLLVIEPAVYEDQRGYFFESYNLDKMDINKFFVQDNQVKSKHGVLRGLHFQKQYPQAKLVRAIYGIVFDVAVDLRRDSKTFGQWYGLILDDNKHRQLYIPEGCAHGYLTLSEFSIFGYKCSDYYCPNDEGGVIWNDKDINILWPKVSNIIISEKDKKLPNFSDLNNEKDN